MRSRLAIFFLYALILSGWGLGSLYAQPFQPVASDTLLQFQTQAVRLGVNTFAYRSSLIANQVKTHAQWWLQANHEHIYNPVQPIDNRFVTADVLLRGGYLYRISKRWSSGVDGQYLDYAANRTRIANIMPFALYQWQQDRWMAQAWVKAGAVQDRRIQFNDQGLGVELGGSIARQGADSSWWASLQAVVAQQRISPRLNETGRVALRLGQAFNQFANAELRLGYYSRRIEDYLGPTIQRITSDTAMAQASLTYEFVPGLVLMSDNLFMTPNRSFQYKAIEAGSDRQNTAYGQLDYNLNQQVLFSKGRFEVQVGLQNSLRDRSYNVENNLGLPQGAFNQAVLNERSKDIREATTAWTTRAKWAVNRRHTLYAASVSQLLRVDTRSELNNQDRDEVLYSAEPGWIARWAPTFQTEVRTSGSYRHFIFITAEQSNENFKERILRLEPSFRYSNGGFRWNGTYSLGVTYTVRDFMAEQARNRSNRVLITTHNLAYQIDPKHAVLLDVYRRENRLSQLNWESFRETPIDTVVIWDVNLRWQRQLRYESKNVGKVEFGYRFFRQSRKSQGGLNDGGQTVLANIDNIVLQQGPVLNFQFMATSKLRISFDSWIQFTSIYNTWQASGTSFIGASQTPVELSARQENFVPMFNLQGFWVW